jgi:hypothetical protein
MATEDIGSLYTTKIPGFDEPADIQAALKLYHYGTTETVSTTNDIIANSVTGHFKALDERVSDLESDGIGSAILSSQPTGIHDGYIWIDSTSSGTSQVQYAQASYQTSEPTTPTMGALWVDSDSTPLKLYVWSGSAWREIGA